MPISMWVRQEMPERGARIDEGALAWKVPQGVLNLRDTLALGGPVPLDLGGFPERGDLGIARFAGGMLVATRDAALFNPSKLPSRYLKPSLGREVTLLTHQSAYDMFAYAHWMDGELVRSLSVNPVGKVWESIGAAEAWELQFHHSARPSEPDYPLPYHPLDMSDFALRRLLGLHFEGALEPGLIDPSTVMLHSFTRWGAPLCFVK